MEHVKTEDGTYTAYSTHFEEHYHSTHDGALTESLHKHILPGMQLHEDRREVTILDICFGLGFNTLATLYYLDHYGVDKKIRIVSPEFDVDLIHTLATFPYPQVFEPYRSIIQAVSREYFYQDDRIEITLFLGDAREYLRGCQEHFDLVYQDAFSPEHNPLLWTKEYFADVARVLKPDGVLTSYSTALRTRLALYDNGFNIFLNQGEGFRNATVASRRQELIGFTPVDMVHKIRCNPQIEPLRD